MMMMPYGVHLQMLAVLSFTRTCLVDTHGLVPCQFLHRVMPSNTVVHAKTIRVASKVGCDRRLNCCGNTCRLYLSSFVTKQKYAKTVVSKHKRVQNSEQQSEWQTRARHKHSARVWLTPTSRPRSQRGVVLTQLALYSISELLAHIAWKSVKAFRLQTVCHVRKLNECCFAVGLLTKRNQSLRTSVISSMYSPSMAAAVVTFVSLSLLPVARQKRIN